MTKTETIFRIAGIALLVGAGARASWSQTNPPPRIRIPTTQPTRQPPAVNAPATPKTGVVRIGNASVKAPVLQGKVPLGRVLNARAPIPFQPFPLVDLKTNKPIAANATMMLPNGRQVSAAKYYDTLNKTEQHLNSIGMTLRAKKDLLVEIMPITPPSLVKSQLAKIKTVQSSPTFKANQFAVRKKALDAQVRARAMYEKMKLDAISAKAKDKVDSISHPKTEAPTGPKYFGAGPPPSPALQALAQPAPQFSGTDKPADIVLGDPAYASLNLSTKFVKNMSPLSAYVGVEGRLGLTLLSQPIDPAFVSAGFSAPLIGEKGYTLKLKAPHGPLIPYNKPSEGAKAEGNQGVDLNGEVRTTVVLGIIPVTFAAGIRGKAGIAYSVEFIASGTTPDNQPIDSAWYTKSSQQAVDKSSFAVGLVGHADVFVNATVYASAVAGGEVDLGLCTVGASLGVATDLVLLDGRIVFQVDALIEKPANAKAHGKLTYSGTYQLKQAMAGQLYIEAKLDFCIKSVRYRYYLLQDAGVPPDIKILFEGEPEGDIN